MNPAHRTQDVRPDMIRAAAVANGVCVRPIIQRLVDTQTGREQLVPIDCGSTRDRQCPTCAERSRRLRMQQCREGWHTTEEPLPEPPQPDDQDLDEDQFEDEDSGSRRVRSTRRRQDVPDLPRLPVEHRSIGRAFTGNDGKTYRPSMFNTVTLGSYGKVRTDGTPVDPASYDYRSAALDAMHFPKGIDRLIQNLRRSAGYKLQYFGAIEAQKRLAPHFHAAMRGVIPRRVFQQVVEATYHQVWWPHLDEPVYIGTRVPVWDDRAGGYVDPDDGVPLQTWQQALDEIDDNPAATPMHVLRFGKQTDYQGLLAGTRDSERRIGYLTKYLTKVIADTNGNQEETSARQRTHIDRLHQEVRWLPCTPSCANWLRYGIQPHDAEPGLMPGDCHHKAHQRENLGCGGRRVLVSRHWTGKTLDQHRADRRAVVEQVLESAGVDVDDRDRYSATATSAGGQPRYLWIPLNPTETPLPSYREAVLSAIEERRRWRDQYEAAKQQLAEAMTGHSATGPPFGSGG
ncbi:MAG: replication initiator [Nocardioidaceae bacterium]